MALARLQEFGRIMTAAEAFGSYVLARYSSYAPWALHIGHNKQALAGLRWLLC